ncbi:MAG: Hsp20/alpha crystallin family protein [bacterium]
MLRVWRPFHELARFDRDFDSLFRNPVRNGDVGTFRPSVDIEETEESFVLTADLPGVDEKEIEITVHEGVLLLSGKRELEREEKTDKGIYRERSHGAFLRKFRLGPNVDPEGIAAAYKHGVLTVTLPKKAEAKPKQIPVVTN